MAQTGGLVIPLDVDDDPFIMSLRRADRQLQTAGARMNRSLARIEGGFQRTTASVKRLAGGMTGLAAAAVAVASSLGAIRAAEFALRLSDAAERLGVTTDALQEFRFAGEQAGISLQSADTALQRFIRRVGEAQGGTGELLGVLQQYDIALRNADGTARDWSEVLADLADATANAESAQEQLRIAVKAFDTEGAALVSALRQGSEAMAEQAEAARTLGQVLDAEVTQRGAFVARFWATLWDAATNVFRRFAIETGALFTDLFVNILQTAATSLQAWAAVAKGLGAEGVAGAIREAADNLEAYLDLLRATAEGTDKLNTGTQVTVQNFGKAVENNWAVFKELAGSIDDMVNSSLPQVSEATKMWREEFESFGQTAAQAIGSAIERAEDFDDAIKSILRTLASRSISRALDAGLGTIFDSLGGAIFGGNRAMGGAVQGGTAYRVGEFGPEYFVPAQSGNIVPGGGGGGPTFFVDARGADVGAVQRLERVVAEMNGSIEPRAVAAVADQRRRTGRTAL